MSAALFIVDMQAEARDPRNRKNTVRRWSRRWVAAASSLENAVHNVRTAYEDQGTYRDADWLFTWSGSEVEDGFIDFPVVT